MNDFIQIPKRKSLTQNQKARIYAASNGICHVCTRKIQAGEKWDADHITPRELSGSDSQSEYAPAHVHCHAKKTKADKKLIAKVKRTQQKHLGLKKKTKWRGWRKMDGTVVWNDD